jgi:NADPH:quinone reductase-like Zn-dependent oxidoreductase
MTATRPAALVTGASSGIGKAAALALAAAGFQVAGTSRKPVMRVLSYRIRRAAKRRHVSYSFLFMRANGDQLREITALIDSQVVHPVMDRVFPFESTREAMAYLEKGRAKGKVVVKVR